MEMFVIVVTAVVSAVVALCSNYVVREFLDYKAEVEKEKHSC